MIFTAESAQTNGGNNARDVIGAATEDTARGNGNDVLYGYGAEDEDPLSGTTRRDDRSRHPWCFESPPGTLIALLVTLTGWFWFEFPAQRCRLPEPAAGSACQPGKIVGFTCHPD